MADIDIRFEPDPSLDHIEVVIRAGEQDAAVRELMEKLSGHPPDTLTVFDGCGNHIVDVGLAGGVVAAVFEELLEAEAQEGCCGSGGVSEDMSRFGISTQTCFW